MPDDCKKCDFDGRSLALGSKQDVKVNTASADVVIVANQIDCMTNIDANAVINEIKTQSKEAQISDLRFAMVGYGNKAYDNGYPTVLTSGGSVWFQASDAPKFDNAGDCNKKTLSALLMATRFDFRPEAEKSVVLLTCLACQRTLDDILLGRYYTIRKQLLSRGIRLHVVSSQDIENNAGKKESKIIGTRNVATL
jgi:hypothetical protein